MEEYNKEKLNKALSKLKEIEDHIESVKEHYAETIETLKNFIDKQYALIDATFDEKLTEDFVPLGNNLFRVKKIKRSVDTQLFVENIRKEIDTLVGVEKGAELFKIARDEAETTKTSINRTKFIKALKEESKKTALDLRGIISATEDKSSEKTIDFQTITGK